MKPKQHQPTAAGTGPKLIPVHFEFTHPTAHTVCIAGTFNDWHPTTKAMHPSGNGRWLKEAFLMPGDHEYCLVVDGIWMPDPRVLNQVPNPFGGRNSVFRVPCPTEVTHAEDAQPLTLKNSNKNKTPIL